MWDSSRDPWGLVRGPHGHGSVNDAGKELLSFFNTYHVTVCNTWFQKKNIHLATWQHPKSKCWHCIDYIVLRQSDKQLCVDVEVKRGAVCNTYHYLLQAKLQMRSKCTRAKPQKSMEV